VIAAGFALGLNYGARGSAAFQRADRQRFDRVRADRPVRLQAGQ